METPVVNVWEAPAEPVVEAPVVPVWEAPAEPVVEAPVVPVWEAPVEPVAETPVVPVWEAPAEPVVETPVVPVWEAPAEPVVDTPVVPVWEAPAEPVIETPVVPVWEAPAEPVVETPVVNVWEAPVEPVVEAPAEPVVEAPVVPVWEAPAEPVAETPVLPDWSAFLDPTPEPPAEPVVEAPVLPDWSAFLDPVPTETPAAPVVEVPAASPVWEPPVAPVWNAPSEPIAETPVAPVAEVSASSFFNVAQDPFFGMPKDLTSVQSEPKKVGFSDRSTWKKASDRLVGNIPEFAPQQFVMHNNGTGGDDLRGWIQQGGVGLGDKIYLDGDYSRPYKVCCINDNNHIPSAKAGERVTLKLSERVPRNLLQTAVTVYGTPTPIINAYNYAGTTEQFFTYLLVNAFPQYEIYADVEHSELSGPVNYLFCKNGKPVLAVFVVNTHDSKGVYRIDKAARIFKADGISCTNFYANYRNDTPYVIKRIQAALG